MREETSILFLRVVIIFKSGNKAPTSRPVTGTALRTSTSISRTHFQEPPPHPIDTTTPVTMFTQTLRASVRAIPSSRCHRTDNCSAPRSPVSRDSKLLAWLPDVPSSLLLPFDKVRFPLIFPYQGNCSPSSEAEHLKLLWHSWVLSRGF